MLRYCKTDDRFLTMDEIIPNCGNDIVIVEYQ